MSTTPIPGEQIAARLDHCLDVEFSFIRTEQAASVLAGLPRARQDYLLLWVERVASTNVQLAHQFISQAIDALEDLAPEVIEAWALHAMDTYDQRGLHPALAVIRDVHRFVRESHERRVGCVLTQASRVLLHFLHGLAGRELELAESEHGAAYTDSETLFLPPLLAILPTPEDNFRLYKAQTAVLWAQTRYGTFRAALSARLGRLPADRLARFHAMETLRLEACLQRELPGLWREMQGLAQTLGEAEWPAEFARLAAPLRLPTALGEDSLALAERHPDLALPPARPWQGVLRPAVVGEVQEARMARERALLKVKLAQMQEEARRQAPPGEAAETRFRLRQAEAPTEPPVGGELLLDEQPVTPPESVQTLITSVLLDLGEIPDDYLVPAGEGEFDPLLLGEAAADPEAVWSGTYHEEGAFLYDEWDFQRQNYRKQWCAVREVPIAPRDDGFVAATLDKYHGLVKKLRKTFEALRDEDRLLKRQTDGDGIDIDAVVEALADARDGSELSARLFTRLHRVERNIAVAFMVDMSGSTRGWINQAERESLVLLCEALESLGDRYAIYGFSGMARKRCEIYPIKTFLEAYDDTVRGRISAIEARDYTRMGFAIRHLSHLLNEVEAKTRILITLSDGKPDDYDHYKGEYAIEDTRRALLEARRTGIHPYCITIDREARDYLPHLYGPAAFTVVDEVGQLPLKVSNIYRRLTS